MPVQAGLVTRPRSTTAIRRWRALTCVGCGLRVLGRQIGTLGRGGQIAESVAPRASPDGRRCLAVRRCATMLSESAPLGVAVHGSRSRIHPVPEVHLHGRHRLKCRDGGKVCRTAPPVVDDQHRALAEREVVAIGGPLANTGRGHDGNREQAKEDAVAQLQPALRNLNSRDASRPSCVRDEIESVRELVSVRVCAPMYSIGSATR